MPRWEVHTEVRDITIDIAVDNTLCDNLFFEDGTPVLPMPSTYYTLAGDKISYNGEHWGKCRGTTHRCIFC